MLNETSLDTLCGALAYAMGIEPPEHAAPANKQIVEYIDQKLGGKKADRIFMYNPDAIGQWVAEKYPKLLRDAKAKIDIEVPMCTVMPSVTPVCYATMYTGAQPEVHGIRSYTKPVITIDTLFDALLRAGKKAALVTYEKCSLSRIFLERNMDYYHYEDGDIADVNAKALELIAKDEHDLIVIYNGNYDSVMHKYGPESPEALTELGINCHMFATLSRLIENTWGHHDTLVGFAMDHGCHEIDGGCGSHGLDMPEDLEIMHLYKGYPREETR